MLILNPPLGQYSVIVTSSYLVTQKQNFSLIVTGGNISFISHDASVPSTLVSSYNPYNCHEDERYVVLTALDHGGNGWGTGNSYEIRDISDNTLVNSGTLSNKAGEQSRKIIPLCLQSDRNYSISLITNGTSTDSDSDEMGLEISPCNIFLSKYMTSSIFTISSTTMSSYCGDCENKFKLQILLSGSFYGVPYGWNQPSHYILWNSVNSNMIYSGTLITGMYSLHSYCLTSEIWYLEFSDVPSNDDGFITNSNIAQRFGVEEYLMTVTDGINEVSISPGQRTTIIVNGTSATLSIGSVAPTSSPTFAPTRSPSVSPSATPSKLCTSFDIEVSK